MRWLLTRNSGDRWLEDASSSQESDAYPPSTAFAIAGVIWVIIIVSYIIVVALDYKRERDLQTLGHHQSRSRRLTALETLEKSIFFVPEHNQDMVWMDHDDATEVSVKQAAILSADFNFQTLFFALVQASLSMVLLGGIQLNFHLTIIIFFILVLLWTCLVGVVMTIWMSRVAEKESLHAEKYIDNESLVLRELKQEMKRGKSLSFIRHYVEVSFFQPMINTSQISAGDIYQDIGRNACRTLLSGVGQVILLSIYTWSIVDDGKPELSNVRLYSYYSCGIMIQIAFLSGQDMFYKSISSHLSFWGNVFCAANRRYAYAWEPPKYLFYHRPRITVSGGIRKFNRQAVLRLNNTPFLWFRFILSTVVNIGGLIIITLLLPLQLANNEDPLAFVLSAVGAYYILGIDDYNEPSTYTLVTEPKHPTPPTMEMTSSIGFRKTGDETERGDEASVSPEDFRYSYYASY